MVESLRGTHFHQYLLASILPLIVESHMGLCLSKLHCCLQMLVTNAQAYNDTNFITTAKCFTIQTCSLYYKSFTIVNDSGQYYKIVIKIIITILAKALLGS